MTPSTRAPSPRRLRDAGALRRRGARPGDHAPSPGGRLLLVRLPGKGPGGKPRIALRAAPDGGVGGGGGGGADLGGLGELAAARAHLAANGVRVRDPSPGAVRARGCHWWLPDGAVVDVFGPVHASDGRVGVLNHYDAVLNAGYGAPAGQEPRLTEEAVHRGWVRCTGLSPHTSLQLDVGNPRAVRVAEDFLRDETRHGGTVWVDDSVRGLACRFPNEAFQRVGGRLPAAIRLADCRPYDPPRRPDWVEPPHRRAVRPRYPAPPAPPPAAGDPLNPNVPTVG